MKNIQIRFKKDGFNTTITVRENILNLYSNTFFDTDYKNKSKFINSQIKNLVNPTSKNNLSQIVSKFLVELVQKKVNDLKKELEDCN